MFRDRIFALMKTRKERSPVSLDLLEVLFAVLMGVLTYLYLHNYYFPTMQPYPWDYKSPDTLPSWFVQGRDELIRTWTVPLTSIMAISAIWVIRAIRNDVRYFSRLGHIGFALPVLDWFVVVLLGFWSSLLGFLPPIQWLLVGIAYYQLVTHIGSIVFAIALLIRTIVTKDSKGNWVAVAWTILWLVIIFQFDEQVAHITTD